MTLSKADLRHILGEALRSPLVPCATDPYLPAIYTERMVLAFIAFSWQILPPVIYIDCAWAEL